jgi:hypothetical protein
LTSPGKPISWVSLACQIQWDWNPEETLNDVIRIVLTQRLLEG